MKLAAFKVHLIYLSAHLRLFMMNLLRPVAEFNRMLALLLIAQKLIATSCYEVLSYQKQESEIIAIADRSQRMCELLLKDVTG